MKLKRYDIVDKYPGSMIVREEEDGKWVKYKDVALAVEAWKVIMGLKDK